MQVNNFKRLQEEAEQVYAERHEENVRTGILNSLNSFRLVGHVLDMFLPKIFNLFVVAVGGKVNQQAYYPTSTPPSEIIDEKITNQKPGSPGTDHLIR